MGPDHSTDDTSSDTPRTLARTALVFGVGLAAGMLAGLFGVGGGVIIVPALVAVLGMDQRRAAATSLLAISITAGVGSITYAASGQVSLVAAAFLVPGALVGAQIGVWLLRRLPEPILPWIFIAFTVFVIVSGQFHVAVRDAELVLDLPRSIGLVAVGLVSGIFAGLIGVGGGMVVMPGLELLVGTGDLLARGTSLVVMIVTALTGTWTNVRNSLVDMRVGLLVGVGAALSTPAGAWLAAWISPATGKILFNCFLVAIIIHMLVTQRAKARAARAITEET